MKKIYALLPALLLLRVAVSQVIPEWTTLYNSSNGFGDLGYSIEVDASGNVLVAGASLNRTSNTTDALIVKFGPAGDMRWSMRYAGNGNWDDAFNAVAVDDENNIYLAGFADEGPDGMEFLVYKLNPDGSEVWKRFYSGLDEGRDDEAVDVAVDNNGNVFVTGSSAGYSSSYWTDFATIKYSPGGDTLWASRLGGSGMPNDRATSIVVDKHGYAYVTGYMEGSVNERYNFATVKYTPDGDTAWLRTYNGTGSDEDRAVAIAIDDERNVFVTGSSWGTMSDYATIKYDSSGNVKWVSRYNGPANSDDLAMDLKVDGEGNVYVTGYSAGSNLKYDCLTICYNPLGGEEWVARYNGPDNLEDYATGIAIDNTPQIFITGYSKNAPSPNISTSDIITISYDAEGNEKWVHRYNGPGDYNDLAGSITTDNSGAAYITGSCMYYQQSSPTNLVAIKYAAPNSVESPDKNHFHITGFPNPAFNDLTISSSQDLSGGTLEINDLSGRIALSSILSSKERASVSVGKLLPGFYTFRVTLNSGVSSAQKLIITR